MMQEARNKDAEGVLILLYLGLTMSLRTAPVDCRPCFILAILYALQVPEEEESNLINLKG